MASSLENTLPSDNLVNISEILGRGYTSLCTLLFNAVRSIHIRIFPPGFGAIVKPEHQSVGSSTGSITLISSILSISAFAWSLKPAAIGLGENKRRGVASSRKFILKVLGIIPKPLKTLGYCLTGSNSSLHTAFTIASKLRFFSSHNPNRLNLDPLSTYTDALVDFSLLSKSTSDLPSTDSGEPSALDKTRSLFLSLRFNALQVLSVTVETSAPVSITNSV